MSAQMEKYPEEKRRLYWLAENSICFFYLVFYSENLNVSPLKRVDTGTLNLFINAKVNTLTHLFKKLRLFVDGQLFILHILIIFLSLLKMLNPDILSPLFQLFLFFFAMNFDFFPSCHLFTQFFSFLFFFTLHSTHSFFLSFFLFCF